MILRALYTLVLVLLSPYVAFHLWHRGRRQPEYLEHVGERFGFYPSGNAGPGLIWIHAVSVGETRAAQPLVRALRARYPQRPILLTHMTPTGRQTSRELFGEHVQRCYLAYDFPFSVARFLDRFRPELGILMETEIWPNLVAACRRRRIPLVLANARLSEKSMRGYAWLGPLARATLGDLSDVIAQTESDAVRLRSLGARDVSVFGNIKFDIPPSTSQMEAGRALRATFGSRKVLLAASTREGEEALIVDALRERSLGDALLVIVPRHPQRFDQVAALLADNGFKLTRRSAGIAVTGDTQVLLGDTMGEMFMYYALSDVAFVGGSLLPLGGQNLIEACAVGVPVLIGPHTFNFAEATEQAMSAGAAQRVSDAGELLRAALELLSDEHKRRAMAAAGIAFAQRHRGATERTMDRLARIIEAGR